jgi:DNA modification methylase
MNRVIERKVEDTTWDYQGEFTKTYTHGFHSYPAMMIPQVARRVILEYSKEKDTLLDPFCGSGSVLVEAKLNKIVRL